MSGTLSKTALFTALIAAKEMAANPEIGVVKAVENAMGEVEGTDDDRPIARDLAMLLVDFGEAIAKR